MSTLNQYLEQKKQALDARNERLGQLTAVEPNHLKAQVRVAGRSGIREIAIRDFRVLSDSPPDFAGYGLGPSSPELQLGVLGSCLSHMVLIHAAERGVALDAVNVEVTGDNHPLGGKPGYEHVPVHLHNIHYKLVIESGEPEDKLIALHRIVEQQCPIFNLLTLPQQISGELVISKGSH